jgi:hypothetical protein
MNSVFNDPRARQQFAASDAANRRVLVGPIDPAVIVLRTVDGVPLVPAGFVHALIVERSTTRRRVANPEVLVFIEQGDAMEVQAPMRSFRCGASVKFGDARESFIDANP